jgi:hypothetical protein
MSKALEVVTAIATIEVGCSPEAGKKAWQSRTWGVFLMNCWFIVI